MKIAKYWHKSGGSSVQCDLCPHACVIDVGKRGRCRSRENVNGELIARNYGKTIALSIDPIEKKPLYHYHPGSRILSLGPNSCNLSCFFCQNYTISQFEAGTMNTTTDQARDFFLRHSDLPRQVAFTYTEPLTWYEYIMDFAAALPDLDIVLVTNGFIASEPLEELLPHVSAMNIDLKSIRDEFYMRHCGGHIDPVLHTIRRAIELGVHVEITNLLIPGLNDSEEDALALAQFVSQLGKDIPLHLSAYHPAFRSSIPGTPDSVIKRACDIAKQYLAYVYAGNSFLGEYRDSICPVCGTVLVHRSSPGGVKAAANIVDGKCGNCSAKIYGRFW